MIGVTGVNLFGIKITDDEYNELLKSLQKTYDILIDEDRKWDDIEFRKRQIGVLYDAILINTIRKIEKKSYRNNYDSSDIELNLNKDNVRFMEVYGKLLLKNEGLDSIIKKMDEQEFYDGSIEIAHNDLYYRGKNRVTIETERILKKMVSESGKTQNNLKNLIENLTNYKSITTPKMIAGILTISLMARSLIINIGLSDLKLFIIIILNIVCSIWDSYGNFVNFTEAAHQIWRRFKIR